MTTKPATRSQRHAFNPNIHGARGLFSLLVFVFHIANSKLPAPVPFDETYQVALSSLAFGVELFFIISGIVILGAFERATSSGKFLVDRITRIFPVLWVAVLVMFVLTFLGSDVFDGASASEIVLVVLGNFLALPPIVPIPLIHGAAWSLSYEFAFYLLFVAFGLLSGFLGRRQALLLTVLLAVAVYWFHVRAVFFVGGLIIGAGWMRDPRFATILRFPLAWMLVFLVSWQTVAVMVGGNIVSAVFTRLFAEPVLLLPTTVAFVAALFAMAGIDEGYGRLCVWLRRPIMQWMGTISFSFYLWQTPVLAVVKRAMYETGLVDLSGSLAQPVFFVLALPPTLVISALSQRHLEIGFTNWLRSHRIFGPATHTRTSKSA